MNMLFKAIGLLTVFFSCALLGFAEARRLQMRKKRLVSLCRSFTELRERLCAGAAEREPLLALCFPSGEIETEGGDLRISAENLKTQDIALINEFLRDFGMGDAATETERIGVYLSLLQAQYTEAERECRDHCRLYQSLGILCGAFLCIFLL